MKEGIKHPTIIFRDFNSNETDELIKSAQKGNIQSKLEIIVHNQAVLNEKLNKLIDSNHS